MSPAGELDRAALGQLVFGDAAARKRLNAAAHAPVAVALLLQLLGYWLRHTRCVVSGMWCAWHWVGRRTQTISS